jgi:DNA-binding transcriptional LysR family regulator
VRDLMSEELDAAILRLPCSSSSALTHHLIDEEEMLIALPPHHPLASTGAIAIEALAHDPFILFPRELGPGLHDAITQRCQRAGFSPRLGSQSPQVISTVGMVQAGFGVAIIPRSVSELHPHGVSYHPIADEPLTTRISLATRRHPRQKSLQHLIGLIPSRRDRHTDIASA